MSVPNGYDLFEKEWPPQALPEDIATHPLYDQFIAAAKAQGFATDSGGFKGCEDGYFLFFLLGSESRRI